MGCVTGSLCFTVVLASLAFAQQPQKTFGFVPQAEERYRLQPGMYYAVGPITAKQIRVDLSSTTSVGIGVVTAAAWQYAVSGRSHPSQLGYWCYKPGVLKLAFTCDLNGTVSTNIFGQEQYVVVLMDQRPPPQGTSPADLLAGFGVLLMGSDAVLQNALKDRTPQFNDVSVIQYTWGCTGNCNIPDPPPPAVWSWVDLVKDKYPVARRTKFFGPIKASAAGESISVNVKSPVAVSVFMVKTAAADRLRSEPDKLAEIFSISNCRQRGARKVEMVCRLEPTDGEQEFIVAPAEDGEAIWPDKKVTFRISSRRCVANCESKEE